MRLANAEDGDVAGVVAAIAEEQSIDLGQAATVYIAKDTRDSSEVCACCGVVSRMCTCRRGS